MPNMYSEMNSPVPDGCVVYCPDDAIRDDDGSHVHTPDPPVYASMVPGEELAHGAATPRESPLLRMQAVLDRLNQLYEQKWSADNGDGLQSEVLVPQWCTNYSDAYNGAPSAKLSNLETPLQGQSAANTQVVCNSFEMSAQPKIMLNMACLPEITSSTNKKDVLLDDALNFSGVKQEEGKIQALPYQRLEVAQRWAGLKHANSTTSDPRQQEAASVGSIGHPHCCAQACKYVKRKSGCRDGSQCPNCHLCHWQRTKVAQQPHATVDQLPGEVTSRSVLERASLSEPVKIDKSVPDGCLVYCPDNTRRDDDRSLMRTPDPPVYEELAQGAAAPRESRHLRMQAVLDKLNQLSEHKWCADGSDGLQSEVLVPRWCTDYIDAHNGAPSAKVSSLETPPHGQGGANTQVVCNSLEMPAQPKLLLNMASLPEIPSSTARREISLDDALNACSVVPHQGPEVAQRLAGQHANPPKRDLHQQEAASAGSIGHPHFCAQACKHVRRKSGCRDGKNCPNCHLCRWQRTTVALQPHAAWDRCPEEMTSQHILERASLSEPMKIDLLQSENLYVEAASKSHSEAHIRQWFDDSEDAVPRLQQHQCPEQESVSRPDCCFSIGSFAHPHGCGLPCKYAGKKKGCKDGYLCTRCHVCKWNRYGQQHTDVPCSPVTHLQL